MGGLAPHGPHRRGHRLSKRFSRVRAVNDGASRGLITASEQSLLVWYLQQALLGSAKIRLGQLNGEVNNQSGKAISDAEGCCSAGQRPVCENPLAGWSALRSAARYI